MNLDWFQPEAMELPKHWIGIPKDWQWLGESPWKHLVSLTPEQMATHSLLIGATGSGKTNLLHHLISQDLLRGHSIVLLDLRGDLVSATLELCARCKVRPDLVKLIDLREKGTPFGFNPLYGAGEPYFRALGVLDVIASESDSWGVQLAETLRNALLLLAEAEEPITKLESLMYDRAFRLGLLEKSDCESLQGFWNRFDSFSGDRQAALVMPVLNKVSMLLATKTMRNILGHVQPIDLGQHLNSRGSVLLVSLAVDELHASAKMMGRLALASICREVFARATIPENVRNPVRLYVDEFEHFGSDEFESILAEGRRFKLSVVLAHQTLSQISGKLRSLILGNVGVKFFFRCGREDSTTLSKDITGGPKDLDLTTLRTGEAVLWRRDLDDVLLEINEPIIVEPSANQEQKSIYIQRVYAHANAAPQQSTPKCGSAKEVKPVAGESTELRDLLCD